MNKPIIKIIKPGLGILIILLVCAAVYFPALDSRFLLDDYYNLNELEEVGTKGYSSFIFSGFAGPSGRPVSMLSFALQYQDWPHDRFSFKLVNLIIHLLNGILIFLITLLLFEFTGLGKKYCNSFALLVTFLWLIQPIQISAVLYVVQRMTLLSAFFTLAGILVYLYLWRTWQTNTVDKKSVLLSTLFGACLVFAVFSKENGILLPVLILSIEFTLLSSIHRQKIWKLWTGIFVLLPIVMVSIYLISGFENAITGYLVRPYTMVERLLTEARILFQYLYNIVLPRPSAFGLYHDDYNFSTGLFSPPTTLFSVAGVIFLVLSGIIKRGKMPVAAFSILWFFGSHLLESTYLNLELYFEHRNYLAAYSICFLLIWLCLKIFSHVNNRIIGFSLIAAAVSPSVIVSLMELDLWSKPIEQALEWQRRSPHSMRAMEDIGNLYILHGDGDKALEVFREMKDVYPDEVYPYIKEVNIKTCLQNTSITNEEWKLILDKAEQAKYYGLGVITEIDALANNIQKGKCETINQYLLIRFVVILAHNREYERHWGILHELAAILSMNLGEFEAALNNINRALALRPTSSNHVLRIRMLFALGMLDEARVAINEFNQYLNTNRRAYLANKDILEGFEKKLERMESSNSNGGT